MLDQSRLKNSPCGNLPVAVPRPRGQVQCEELTSLRTSAAGPASHAASRSMPLEDDTPFDVPDAFAQHGGALLGFALNALGNRAEAEDCVQEVFIRAWRSRERYDGARGSARTWLFAIARNLVIDALRARVRRPVPSEAEHLEWASEPVTEDVSIVERLALYESLARLSFEHRQVISAVQLDGTSYQELSERTGVPVATLRTRMYYGLRSLRTVLGDIDAG